MGMRAHLVPVSAEQATEIAGWSARQIIDLLRESPDARAIDKSWEAAFPLIGEITGGGMMIVDDPTPVGDDLGYGPAMFISPEQVASISAQLADVDDATVATHLSELDSPFMLSGRYDEPEGREFALDGFRLTAELFRTAADGRDGVLFAIL